MRTHTAQSCLFISLFSIISGHLFAQSWKLTGNKQINPDKNFVGTTDGQPLIFKTNDQERMRILKTGKIGMGTKKPEAVLNIISPDYASLSSPGYLMLGDVTGYNMALDIDVIQARYNGTAAALYLNYYGGHTYLGPSGIIGISSSGAMTTGLVGINGNYNGSYALNVNASSSYNGINVTDGGNAFAFNASKSGLLAGIICSKNKHYKF